MSPLPSLSFCMTRAVPLILFSFAQYFTFNSASMFYSQCSKKKKKTLGIEDFFIYFMLMQFLLHKRSGKMKHFLSRCTPHDLSAYHSTKGLLQTHF